MYSYIIFISFLQITDDNVFESEKKEKFYLVYWDLKR